MCLKKMSNQSKFKAIFAVFVGLFFLLSFLVSILLGPTTLSLRELSQVFLEGPSISNAAGTIFWQIRLPRVLLAFLIGAALSLAGAILQGLFLNPLADPYVTGVSSGAAFGATTAFFFRLSPIPWLSFFAFFGGFLTLIFVYFLARRKGLVNIYVLLLAGVAVSAFFSSLVAVLMVKSGKDLHALVFWLMGSFSGRSWPDVKLSLIALPLFLISFFFVDELNILLQGEERALELGVEVEKVKKILFLIASSLTAVAVAASGIIGFIGLIIPHMARLILGPDHRRVFVLSIFLGAAVMGLSDLCARVIFAPSEMPVGVVTSFFGAPFFLYLLRKKGD